MGIDLKTLEQWDKEEQPPKKKALVPEVSADKGSEKPTGITLDTLDQWDQETGPAPILSPETPETEERWEVTKGLLRGVDSLQGMAHGAVGIVGSKVGADSVRDWGFEGYKRNMEEAAENPAAVESFRDIDGVKKAGQWVMGTIGELAPSLAEAGVAALAGASAGSAAAPGPGTVGGAVAGFFGKTVIKKAMKEMVEAGVKKGIKREVAEELAKRAILKNVGAKTGAVLATAQMEAGGMWGDAAERFGVEVSDPDSALALGLVSGFVELAGGNIRLIDKVLGKQAGKVFGEAVQKKKPGVIANMVREAAKEAPEEFLQEGAQELISLSNVALHDPSFEVLTKENLMQAFEAGMAGAVGGVAFGGIGGAYEAMGNRAEGTEGQAGAEIPETPESRPLSEQTADMFKQLEAQLPDFPQESQHSRVSKLFDELDQQVAGLRQEMSLETAPGAFAQLYKNMEHDAAQLMRGFNARLPMDEGPVLTPPFDDQGSIPSTPGGPAATPGTEFAEDETLSTTVRIEDLARRIQNLKTNPRPTPTQAQALEEFRAELRQLIEERNQVTNTPGGPMPEPNQGTIIDQETAVPDVSTQGAGEVLPPPASKSELPGNVESSATPAIKNQKTGKIEAPLRVDDLSEKAIIEPASVSGKEDSGEQVETLPKEHQKWASKYSNNKELRVAGMTRNGEVVFESPDGIRTLKRSARHKEVEEDSRIIDTLIPEYPHQGKFLTQQELVDRDRLVAERIGKWKKGDKVTVDIYNRDKKASEERPATIEAFTPSMSLISSINLRHSGVVASTPKAEHSPNYRVRFADGTVETHVSEGAIKGQKGETKAPIDDEFNALSVNEIMGKFDDVVEENEQQEATQKPTTAEPRKETGGGSAPSTTGKAKAKEAAKHAAKGTSEWAKGLVDLFGGTDSLQSFPGGLNRDTYEKAKVHFERGFAEYKDAGRSLKEFMQWIYDNIGKTVRAYLDAWVREKKGENIDNLFTSANIDSEKEEPTHGQTQDREGENRQELSSVGESESRGDDRGRGDSSQSGSSQADSGDLGTGKPADVEGTAAATGLGRTAGVRSPGNDVEGSRQSDSSRIPADGREGAGGTRVADAGAGRTGGSERLKTPENFHVDDPLQISGGGQVARFNKNKGAIELYHQLTDEQRHPTKEEQSILAGYTGWGSFGQELFNGSWDKPKPKEGWEERDAWLRDHLGEKDWKSAQNSIRNAHYTDPPTVLAMWDMVKRMGFKGGKVSEPAMGIGNFFGMMPKTVKSRSSLTGIELDSLSGGMAKLLYPKANISIKPFQNSKTPDDFYDLVIGNWPFDSLRPADRRYQKLNPVLHDYFFIKALDQVRPGGLVVGITSNGTMDKIDRTARRAMAQKAELISAFRLPTGAFKEYAGTAVVTDIIILRKREKPLGMVEDSWIQSKEFETPGGEMVNLNKYYHENPDHVLGTIDFGHGTTRGRAGLVVHRPENMMERLRQAVDMVPKGAYLKDKKADNISYITNHTDDRQNALTVDKGKLFIVRGEHLAPAEQVLKYAVKDPKSTAKREAQLHHLISLRKDYAKLIDAERTEKGDVEAARKALKENYDRFVKDHGLLSESFGIKYLFRIGDPFYPSLAALESPDGKGSFRSAKILFESTIRGATKIESPSITQAFVLARNQNVRPTLADVAEISGKTEDEARKELVESGAVFESLDGDIIPADIYLSGNVRRKLADAQAWVAEGNTHLERNVKALEKVIPKDIPYHKIETQFGATWITEQAYRDYIAHMLNLPSSDQIGVTFIVGRWKVRFPSSYDHLPEANAGFGTQHANFKRVVNAAISNQTITIKYKDNEGKTHVDEEGTQEVNARIERIREEFKQWLWGDPERRVEMERSYNDTMNAYATPKFDGSFLTFPGMALEFGDSPFNLREHQVNAIWRGIVTRKSLNAHEVGTGKTFTMGGIAVESRRYGIARKPLLMAHNANSASVAAEIQQMYPAAKILYVDNLSPDTIDIKLRQIANDDWDCVVMPHSLIDRLTFREETLMAMAQGEIEALEAEALDAAADDDVDLDLNMMDDPEEMKKVRSPTAKDLVAARNKILENIRKQGQRASRESAVPFEELGVDMLMVDEAHEFKKPPIATKMRMKGLNTATSNRSIALRFLTSYIRANNEEGNVHLFTGTPITNTLTEIYHHMRYIMESEMSEIGVDAWDGWFGAFAAEVQDIELNAAGEYENVVRLASFVNVSDLRRMLGQYMDVVFSDDMPEMALRETKSGKKMDDETLTEKERIELENSRTEGATNRPYKKIIVDNADMTPRQVREFERLQKLAGEFRKASPKARYDWLKSGDEHSPIIIEGKANKASLDVRLLDGRSLAGQEGQAEDHESSKVSRAVKNILEIYNSHEKACQAVFTETGIGTRATRTSRTEDGEAQRFSFPVFSPVNDMVARLVAGGIPREQIAVVTGSTSKQKRKEIADAMNRTEIRVVVGNTQTLGVGVNMQRNLRAMHHLDAPWMPGDLEQRNGRGHRQANQWNTVLEYRYITDRLDGRRWQILSIKDRFIKEFLRANDDVRVIEGDAAADEQSDILETFADASGDPRVLLLEKARRKVEKLQMKERLHTFAVSEARGNIRRLENNVEEDTTEKERYFQANGIVENIKNALASNKGDNFKGYVGGKEYRKRKDFDEALTAFAEENLRMGDKGVLVGSVGGLELKAHFSGLSDRPGLEVFIPYGEKGKWEVSTGAASLASIEASIRNEIKRAEKLDEQINKAQSSIERMKEVAAESFQQADDLQAAIEIEADLMADMEANPVPPPAWLRSGAPTETVVYWNKKPFEVVGHKWTAEGWFVVGQDEKGKTNIPYDKVTDETGVRLYESKEFEAPKVVEQPKKEDAEAPKASRRVKDEEIPIVDVEPFDVEPEKLWATANEFYRENLQGKTVQNPRIGEIQFSAKGRTKALSVGRRDPKRMSLVRNLEKLAEAAVPFKTVGDRKGKVDISGFKYAVVPAKIDNEIYAIKLVMKEYSGLGERKFYTFAGYEMVEPGAIDRRVVAKAPLPFQGSPGSKMSLSALIDSVNGDPLFSRRLIESEVVQENKSLLADVKRLRERKAELEKLFGEFTESWENAPRIKVLESIEDLPNDILDYTASVNDETLLDEAFFSPRNNTVYMIAANLPTNARAVHVLIHETRGHYGLRGVLPKGKLNPVLDHVAMVRGPEVKAMAEMLKLDMSKKEERREAAEEVLAEMAARGEQNGFIRQIIAIVKDWIRSLNIDLKYSDADIVHLIAKSKRFVEKGQGGKRTDGKPKASRKEDAFKKWFGKSKVVDGEGNPLMVYHGTQANFSEFRTDQDLGSHFGTQEQADIFTEKRGNVMPVYLSIKNPLRLEDRGQFSGSEVAPQLVDMGILTDEEAAKFYDARFDDKETNVELQKIIQDAGYDGVVYLNRREGDHDPFGPDGVDGDILNEMSDYMVEEMFPDAADSYIVFSPNQIKSAFNSGTWDASISDIRFSRRPISTGNPTMDAELDKEVPGWRKNVENMVRASLKNPSGTIPERVKALAGKFMSNPWFGSEGNAGRRAVVDLNLQRGEERTAIVYDLDKKNEELKYAGLEGMREILSSLTKKERRQVDRIIKEGDTLNEAFKDSNLISGKNPLNTKFSKGVVAAYRAFRQVVRVSRETMFQKLDDLALIPYEASPFYPDLKRLIEAGRTVKQVKDDPKIDDDLKAAFIKLKGYKTRLGELKQEWGFQKGYAPRVRPDGEWFVRVYTKDKDGNRVQVYMRPTKTRVGAESLKSKVQGDLKGHLKGNFDPKSKYTFTIDRNEATPEELMQFKGTDMALETLITAATDKAVKAGDMTVEEATGLQEAVLTELADMISARGFGKSRIQRQENLIEGYDDENYVDILQGHVSGMAGWLTKAEFSMRATRAASKVKAPEDKTWINSYVQDAMQNSTYMDQIMATGRTYATLMYLGGKISTSVLNATQNYIVGQAELSKHTKSPLKKLVAAQRDVLRGKLSKEELEILEEGQRRGRTRAQYVREISGLNEMGPGDRFNKTLRWLTEKSMIPFQAVESRWNREPALIAAYRVFRAEKNLSKAEAFKKAEEFVNNVHFVIGKENMPEMLRKMGGLGRTLYTFQSYTHNYLHWLANRAKDREIKVLLRSMAALAALGGVAALPGADDLDKWIQKLFGNSPLLALKKYLGMVDETMGTGTRVTDFVVHGLPSQIGVNFSRSLGVGVPFLSGDDDSLAERFTGVWSGVAQKTGRAASVLRKGDLFRAFENSPLTPEAIANLMRAGRQYTRGQTTFSGKPVFDENGQQVRYTVGDAVKKGLGFNPLEPSRRQENRSAAYNLETFWKERRSDLITQYRIADRAGRKKAWENIREFNRELKTRQAGPLISPITADTLYRAVNPRANKRRQEFMKQ